MFKCLIGHEFSVKKTNGFVFSLALKQVNKSNLSAVGYRTMRVREWKSVRSTHDGGGRREGHTWGPGVEFRVPGSSRGPGPATGRTPSG